VIDRPKEPDAGPQVRFCERRGGAIHRAYSTASTRGSVFVADERVRRWPIHKALEPSTFTYLQDPGHGWLIVSRGDLAGAGMSPADLSSCSYVSGDTLALEEDCDMPRFLKRLDEQGIPYRLREQHTRTQAHVRRWAANPGPAAP
jgi:hypothetical protein